MIELCEEKKCTGCEACTNICPESCISMQTLEEGFLYPKINHNLCIECCLCQKVCPEIHPVSFNTPEPKTYAAWNLQHTVRQNSTSGGIFTALAQTTFKKGGVVYGAVLQPNWEVHHSAATTNQELLPQTGSKYVQSKIGFIFREIDKKLKQQSPVLFCGTPCQVAGLKKFIGNNHQNLLLTVDFVCHGVPSPKLFKYYIHQLKAKYPHLESFAFRDKKSWTPKQKIKVNGRWVAINKHENVFFRLFWYGITIRESCYSCQYAQSARVSDFTLGDFWGISKKSPFITDREKGISLLLANTKKAEKILEEINSGIFISRRQLIEAVNGNKHLRVPVKRHPLRDIIYTDIFRLSLSEIDEKYTLPFFPRWKILLKKIKKLSKMF